MPQQKYTDTFDSEHNIVKLRPAMENGYFHSVAGYWEKLYEESDLTSRVYQERKNVALSWIEQFSLPAGARVLDLGCGAGYTAVALAHCGYQVYAVDSEQAMLEMTSRRAVAGGVKITTALADAHALTFADGTFDLVLALGVVPWLHSPRNALREMRRVLKPGGFLVVSCDNRKRLTSLLDPVYSPVLANYRKWVASTLRKWEWMRAPHTSLHLQTLHEFDMWLVEAGFRKTNSVTIGFGPFTVFRCDVLPDRLGTAIHQRLQKLAYRKRLFLRERGAHYLVAATTADLRTGELFPARPANPAVYEPNSFDVSTPVLILGGNTHGSLGIMRSLGRLGVAVHAVCSPPRGPASYSAYCKSVAMWDFAHADPQDTVSFLLEVAGKIGQRSILIPTWDEMAVFTAEYHRVLKAGFIYPQQSGELARSLCDKKEMARLAREFGVPTPQADFPRSLDDVLQYLESARFPVMLKGIDGNKLKERTGKKMVIVYSPRQLREMYLALEDPASPNLMLQEYIPGGDDRIWMFNGYFNSESECLAGFTGRKLRQTPIHTGMTSLGVCLENEVVANTTKQFMRALGYKGILDIGYRYDSRDCQYKVLDVNPRIGATFRLFLAENGIDVARALYLDMTGQQVPASPQREGRKWFVESDLKSCLDYYREGSLTFRQWLNSLRGIEEAGYFARDDLRPMRKLFAMVAGNFAKRVRLPTKSSDTTPDPRNFPTAAKS